MQAKKPAKPKPSKEQRRKSAWFASKEGQAYLAARRAQADWSAMDRF